MISFFWLSDSNQSACAFLFGWRQRLLLIVLLNSDFFRRDVFLFLSDRNGQRLSLDSCFFLRRCLDLFFLYFLGRFFVSNFVFLWGQIKVVEIVGFKFLQGSKFKHFGCVEFLFLFELNILPFGLYFW